MNEKEHKKIKRHILIGIITWMFYFAVWYISYIVSTPPASSGLKTVFFVNTGLGGIVAATLAVFFYDLMTSKKEGSIRFEFVENNHRRHIDVKLPEKATENSVGYDFFSPEKMALAPGEEHMFWTDVKVHLKQDEALMISPRSSIGIKKNLMLANTIGMIDPDYYGNEENDGNIGICLYNYGTERALIEKGGRIAQGTVITVVHDKIPGNSNKRKGGIGSTGQ